MDIGTLLALGIMIGFTLKVYLHLKIDFFTFISSNWLWVNKEWDSSTVSSWYLLSNSQAHISNY